MNYLKKQIYKINLIVSFLSALLITLAVAVGRVFHDKIDIVIQIVISLPLGVLAFIVLKIRDKMLSESYNYEKGIRGENYLKNRIKSGIKHGNYRLLQNIKNSKGGDIDIVLICEYGIYAIECKNISGHIKYEQDSDKIFLNNYKKEYLSQVRGNAVSVQEKLEKAGMIIKFITPVLVIMGNCYLDNVPEEIKGTRIYYPNKFIAFLNQQKNVLNNKIDVDKVYGILK